MSKKRKKGQARPGLQDPATPNPAALPTGGLAELLTKAAGGNRPITVEQLRADIAAGAPTNADGTLHIVHYGAWLAAQAD